MRTFFITLNSETKRVEISDMDSNFVLPINHPRDVMFFMGQEMKKADTLFKSSSMDFPTEYTNDKDTLELVAQIEKIFS